MELDEELYKLRKERERIEDDFDDYRRNYQRREEDINATFSMINHLIHNYREQVDTVLREFTDEGEHLMPIYEEHQEMIEQVNRFAIDKMDELEMEYHEQKKIVNRKLDENEDEYRRLLRSM